MRPVKLGPYTPADASTTAFNAQTFNSTGAATAPTTTATTDGLAHLVTLVAPVQSTLAGITFTIVGTDTDGRAVTDAIVGPASGATVTTTKYFKTISTITPSATMGALVVSVGITAASLSRIIPLENSAASAGMTVVVTGTINFTVYETFANVYENASNTAATSITALAAKSATTSGNASVSATGVYLMTNSVTAGATYTVWLNQNFAGAT